MSNPRTGSRKDIYLQVSTCRPIVPHDLNRIDGDKVFLIYVGVTGNLRVLTADGNDITFKNVNPGDFLPVQVVKVFATGTTATDLIAGR